MQESHHMPPPFAENLKKYVNYTPIAAGGRPSIHYLPQLPPTYLSLDWKGKVFWQAMDPFGCQVFHQKLQARKPEDVQMIFSEVKDQVCVLMFDRFGSYVIQKLFQVCDEEQMTQLVSSVTADVRFLEAVCCSSQGSESMIHFFKCLITQEHIYDIISGFQQVTVRLAKDRFGSVVIGSCFRSFPIPAEETMPILEVITDNCLEIATSFSGSSLLTEILVSKVFRLESRPRILMAIIENACQLSQYRFGCQVLMTVTAHGTQDVLRDLVVKLRKDFDTLSIDKFAHDLVMALMMKAKGECLLLIVNDIVQSPNLKRVRLHPYGQLVLQHAEKYLLGTVLAGNRSRDFED